MDALRNFARLFNEGEYFEAHDALEDLWREERKAGSKDANYFQALIQMAAAMVHLKKGKRNSSLSLLEAAQERFAAYPSPYLGIDHRRFWKDCRVWIDEKAEKPWLTIEA